MKQIKLNNRPDLSILVDDDDYEKLNSVIWTWSETCKAPVRRLGPFVKSRLILMHREIMGVDGKDGKIEVDHINHNRLDNQKSNLRLCNRQQNCSNYTRVFKNRKFKYKGVEFRSDGKRSKPWVARKSFKRKNFHLGYFKTQEEAAEAFNRKSIELSGEFAVLNNIAS